MPRACVLSLFVLLIPGCEAPEKGLVDTAAGDATAVEDATDHPEDTGSASVEDSEFTDYDNDGIPGDTTGSEEIEEIEPVTPESFSYVGRAALGALEDSYPDARYVDWNYSADAGFGEDWLLQVPGPETWGMAAAEVPIVPACDPDAAGCHPDFQVPICDDETPCDVGVCREVLATVTAPGGTPERLCTGPSDYVYDEMHEVLTSAERYADVSSLDFPQEGGRFSAALRNGLAYLDAKCGADADCEAVTVRMLFGLQPGTAPWSSWRARGWWSRQVERVIPESTEHLRLFVATMNYSLFSWNHSKIIAADGTHLLEGGINFYTSDYLGDFPVHDVSIRLSGEPAADGHRYLDKTWETVCEVLDGDFASVSTVGSSAILYTAPADAGCPGASPASASLPAEESYPDGARVISLGRHGLISQPEGVFTSPSPSEAAMYEAISSAKKSLRFSLQDLGPYDSGVDGLNYSWPNNLLRRLTRAMLREDPVEVSIVLSSPATEDDEGYFYSYGWTLEEVLEHWRGLLESDPAMSAELAAAGLSASELLCQRLSLAAIRFNDTDDRWPQSDLPIGNHAKVFIVDDAAFYVGSQNLYISNLFEWGLLVDDPALTAVLVSDYWNKLWEYSKRTAVSGPVLADSGGTCALS